MALRYFLTRHYVQVRILEMHMETLNERNKERVVRQSEKALIDLSLVMFN